MEGLFNLFSLTIIISGVMVISALNPVHFVVVTFIGASALFSLLEIYFLALILLIVYVGAIAILFLFVIMMLKITGLEGRDRTNYLPTWIIVSVCVCVWIQVILSHHYSMNVLRKRCCAW